MSPLISRDISKSFLTGVNEREVINLQGTGKGTEVMSLSLRRVNVPARKKRDQREIKLGMENSYISGSCIRPLSHCSPSPLFLYRLSLFPSSLSILLTSFLSPLSLFSLRPLVESIKASVYRNTFTSQLHA